MTTTPSDPNAVHVTQAFIALDAYRNALAEADAGKGRSAIIQRHLGMLATVAAQAASDAGLDVSVTVPDDLDHHNGEGFSPASNSNFLNAHQQNLEALENALGEPQ